MMSTPQGPELHLNVSAQQRLVLLLKVSTPQGLDRHLNVSALQRPVLLLLLIHRDQCILTVEHVHYTLNIICLLLDVFASLQK